MFNNFTIRRGLTITIAGYTLAIVAVLLAAAACLRQSNQALTIKNTHIAEELALPPVKIHCSILAEDAIKAAVADYKQR
ncbi:iron-sulfur cluster assembly scaffold protein, partial [Caballeronia sp. M23-90]